MFYLRLAAAVLGFVAAGAYGVTIALVRRDRTRVARDYARLLHRLMAPAVGLKLRIVGEEGLHAHQPCIYVANHQTIWDVVVLAPLYPRNTVVIAKQEIRRVPFFGWLYEVTGNVYIDRSNREHAVGELKNAERAILEGGKSVWIMPEGTRGKEPGVLLPFKKGPFRMAVATGVPLVPVVVQPLRPLYDMRRRKIRPGTAEVRILEPIPTAGLGEEDVGALLERTRTRMQEELTAMAAG
jgi:1-acyl-sn-glycerol-3-phosphate acyltransferase